MRDRRAAFTAELGCRVQLPPARCAGEARGYQRAVAVSIVIHVSIVSSLVRRRHTLGMAASSNGYDTKDPYRALSPRSGPTC